MTENLFQNYKEGEAEGIKVHGEIPEWLSGSLIRTGPGKWKLDDDFSLNHFYDGCAMIVKFEIDGKKQTVHAKSRFLESDSYKKCCSQKRPVYTEFGTQAFSDQSKSIFSRAFNKMVPSDLTDNDISNVYKINDNEIYMTTESCNIWQIDPKSLDALQKVNLDKKIGVAISCSHPLLDENEKMIYNIGSTFLTGMKYHIMKVPVDSKKDNQKTSFDLSSVICSFPSSYKGNLSYNHSFAMTKNYVIVIEQSLLINAMKLITCTPKGKSMEDCLEWCPDEPSRFHVFDKRTNSMTKHKFTTKGFFYFHTINAYEQDDQIVLDILTYDDHGLLETLRLKNLHAGKFETTSKSRPMRYVLPMSDSKSMKKDENLVTLENSQATAVMNNKDVIELTAQQLGPCGLEMPTVNPAFLGKPYNIIYGTGFLEKGFYENAMGKIDIKNNTSMVYKYSSTTYPGEGVFVASPDADKDDEEDGVILTAILETDMEKNPALAILEGKTLKQLAVIEFDRNKVSCPTTIHGLWLPKKD